MLLFRLISRSLATLTLLGALTAYLYPPSFLIFQTSFLWFFAATMLALGMVLDSGDFATALATPLKIGLGLMTQFTVMPCLAALAAYWAGLDPQLALGFIIVGCAPGAMASNVVVFLSGGATAYSVALTTAATLLSPVLTPALIELLGGVYVPIPFWPIMRTILLIVLLPLIVGLLLHRWLGPSIKPVASIAPAIAVVAIVVIVGVGVASNGDEITSAGPRVFLLVLALNLAGYAAGWEAARLFRFDRSHRTALMIEIGMQNAGLGVALALQHFTPRTALPGVLFAVWCILTAAGATSFLQGKSRTTPAGIASQDTPQGSSSSDKTEKGTDPDRTRHNRQDKGTDPDKRKGAGL